MHRIFHFYDSSVSDCINDKIKGISLINIAIDEFPITAVKYGVFEVPLFIAVDCNGDVISTSRTFEGLF